MADKEFGDEVENFKREVLTLEDEFTDEEVEETALRLERFNFTPPIITPIDKFIRFRKDNVIDEIDRVVTMSEAEACALAPDNKEKCDDLRAQHITVIIFHYKKLLELRRGNSEEWDEIDELYVHD